jgi:hypothetical protein
MSQPAACPDDDQLREYAAGRLRAESFSNVAAHLRSCLKCRLQVFAGEPTIEDDGPHSFRFDLTGDTLDDSERISPRTDYDAKLNRDDADSAVRYLFPDRQGESLGWLGNYEVEYELGRGGMGIVFKGFDPLLHRVVAIKVMAPQLAVNERARMRFSREARAVAAINHPNVVTIHAVSEHKDVPYLVMEYVAGESLEERIRHRRPLPVLEIMRIAAQIADGLAAAHAVGTIHRDVKPANVMLENSVDRVKISDFGLAQVALDYADLTPTNQVLGTPSYMSPEQVEGGEVDARSDIFSLGCVIYAMVVGHSPFMGKHMLDVVRRVSDLEPSRLDEVDPSVPRPLADLVDRMLRKEPRDRVQSADQVAEELRRLLAAESQEPSREATPLYSSPRRRRRWRPPSTRRTVGLLLGLAAAAALAAVGWIVATSLRGRGAAPPGAPPARTGLLTVSAGGAADFSELREAVEYAGPGATIRILDDGRYEGPIVLPRARPRNGLTIESPRGATLVVSRKHAGDGRDVLLSIDGTTDVTVSGLNLECEADQHGVVVYRDVSGTTLKDLRITQPGASRKAAVFLTGGTHGSPERPLRLERLDVTAGNLGIYMGDQNNGAVVSSIRIEDSRIRGVGSLVIMGDDIHDVVVSGCVFADGGNGLVLNLTNAKPVADVAIRNNTLFGLRSWISLGDSRPELQSFTIARNLIVDCDGMYASQHDLAVVGPRWFRDNVWGGARGVPGAEFVARMVDEVRLLSFDSSNPDYLRPEDPASVAVKDAATGEHTFAGAVPPRAEAPTVQPPPPFAAAPAGENP